MKNNEYVEKLENVFIVSYAKPTIESITTTQMSFFFSFSKNFKVTKDALHLMLSYQLVQETRDNKQAYVPIHWKILTLDSLTVDLKHEFNQSNVKMYGRKSEPNSVLAEGKV